jgi:anaerobic magnesium-protoporphyrin IX monomethyl ester cyclase
MLEDRTMIKGKKILFIIPPYYNIRDYRSEQHAAQLPVFTIPYGILSLAAYIKATSAVNAEFDILDLNLEAYKLSNRTDNIRDEIATLIGDRIRERMVKCKPDIVGISALFNTCFNYLELVSVSVKKADCDVLLVIGGGLATNLAPDILQTFQHIDACCNGEGEMPLRQLVDAGDAARYFKSSRCWVTRESLQEGRVPHQELIDNLDEIPFFDYRLIDLDEYTGRSLDKSYAQRSLREISIHTSRGCPYNCVFCSNSTVHGKKIRYMSVEKVVGEVKRMVDIYSVKILLIEDDHFLSDKERAKQILTRLREFGLRIEFPNGIAVYAIDDEVGRLLKEAGVTTISLAVESGSDYVLKNIISKPLQVKMIKPAVEILRSNGISIHAFIVTGLPGELEQHRKETMQMLFHVGFDWVKFFLAIPIAGSRLYEICKESGYLINSDYSQYVTTKANIRTPDLDPEYIEEEIYRMNLEANFVRNYNLMAGNYEKAISHFENIAKRYPEHAFAHYYLSKSYEGSGNNSEKAAYHRGIFREQIKTDGKWANYARQFELDL